jgi:hypothetical protein
MRTKATAVASASSATVDSDTASIPVGISTHSAVHTDSPETSRNKFRDVSITVRPLFQLATPAVPADSSISVQANEHQRYS